MILNDIKINLELKLPDVPIRLDTLAFTVFAVGFPCICLDTVFCPNFIAPNQVMQ